MGHFSNLLIPLLLGSSVLATPTPHVRPPTNTTIDTTGAIDSSLSSLLNGGEPVPASPHDHDTSEHTPSHPSLTSPSSSSPPTVHNGGCTLPGGASLSFINGARKKIRLGRSIRSLLAAGGAGAADVSGALSREWKKRVGKVCDLDLLEKLVGRWREAAVEVKQKVGSARDFLKSRLDSLMGFCRQLAQPVFEKGALVNMLPKINFEALASSYVGASTVTYADVGRIMSEAARRLVRSLAHAARVITNGVAKAYIACLDGAGAVADRAAEEFRRLKLMHRVNRLIAVLVERVRSIDYVGLVSDGGRGAGRSGRIGRPHWPAPRWDLSGVGKIKGGKDSTPVHPVNGDDNASSVRSVTKQGLSKWFEQRPRSSPRRPFTDTTPPTSTTPTHNTTSQRIGGQASKLATPSSRVVTVNVRYKVRQGTQAAVAQDPRAECGGVAAWLLKPGCGGGGDGDGSDGQQQQRKEVIESKLQQAIDGGGSRAKNVAYAAERALVKVAEKAIQVAERTVGVQVLKDKRLRVAAEGLKNLSPETLTQAFGILGRLDGHFHDAEDVEVTVEECTDDGEGGDGSGQWSWLYLIFRAMACTSGAAALTALIAGLYLRRLPPGTPAFTNPTLQRLADLLLSLRHHTTWRDMATKLITYEWRANASRLTASIRGCPWRDMHQKIMGGCGRGVESLKHALTTATAAAGRRWQTLTHRTTTPTTTTPTHTSPHTPRQRPRIFSPFDSPAHVEGDWSTITAVTATAPTPTHDRSTSSVDGFEMVQRPSAEGVEGEADGQNDGGAAESYVVVDGRAQQSEDKPGLKRSQ